MPIFREGLCFNAEIFGGHEFSLTLGEGERARVPLAEGDPDGNEVVIEGTKNGYLWSVKDGSTAIFPSDPIRILGGGYAVRALGQSKPPQKL